MGLADAFDVVDAMAVGADGGELDKPFFKKGLAVNALHVFVIRHFAVNVVLDDDVHIFMTGRAGEGDVLPVDRGFGVSGRPDIVLSVTIPAPGHLADSSFKVGPAVDAVRVRKRSLSLPGQAAFTMTDGRAIDIRKFLFMGKISFSLFGPDEMAICASEESVR